MAYIERHRKVNGKLDIYIEFYGKRTANERESIISEIVDTIMNQEIYFNNLSCEHWSFDYKLPCGAWCENLKWTNALQKVTCMVD